MIEVRIPAPFIINPHPMNCLIYVRVSTDKQAEKALSLQAQLAACRQHATQRGWIILEEFVESGVSARTADRPQLRRLLTRCRRSTDRIQVVLVHKIDRLARNLADHVMIRAVLQRRGIRLVSVQENFEESVSGQLVENIMAAIAEFYSANLAEETKKGMRQKVLNGGWPHQPSRGYVLFSEPDGRRRIQVHLTEGPLIRAAFENYASGRQSLRVIAMELASEGIRSSGGTPLSMAHLRRMLSNPFYAGRIVWKDLDVVGQHPALISKELFERVQAVITQRFRQPGRRGSVQGFPLRGLAQCATCHGRMTAERHGRFGYYRCCRQQYQRARCSARYCNADRIHADLDRICREVTGRRLSGTKNLLLPLEDPRKAASLRAVFASVTLAREGILKYSLKSTVNTLGGAA